MLEVEASAHPAASPCQASSSEASSIAAASGEGLVIHRSLSQKFGEGASKYSVQDMEAWRAMGLEASVACRSQKWVDADGLAAQCCALRPDWPKGYELRRRTMLRSGCTLDDVATMLHGGIAQCEAAGRECRQLHETVASLREPQIGSSSCSSECRVSTDNVEDTVNRHVLKFKTKVKGVKLLPHEQAMMESGQLEDDTHAGASAIWLKASSAVPPSEALATVYRPMGDLEYSHLAEHGLLPDSQPYQTIVEGGEGRTYAEKYLRGHKSVDSSPTTVVEFLAPAELVRRLFAMQSKNEDGAISHGLGSKGGRGLPLFNASLEAGETTFRIVAVKRFEKKAVGAFGAGRKKL